MPDHHHRAGGLRQTNKKNKRSKASKRSVSRLAGGKVMGAKSAGASMISQSKADRRNHAGQKRAARREELMRKKRGLDGLPAPPRVVGILSLGHNIRIEDQVKSFILESADKTLNLHANFDATVTCKFDTYKKSGGLTLLTCRSSFAHHGDGDDAAVLAALDMARVCDALIFVIDGNGGRVDDKIMEINIGEDDQSSSTNRSTYGMDWSHLISERGDRMLTAIKSQGLPTPLSVLAMTEKEALEVDDQMTVRSVKSFRRSSIKRSLDLKRYVGRFAATEFGRDNGRVLEIDLTGSEEISFEDTDDARKIRKEKGADALVRTLCSMSCSAAKWVANSPRGYILSDSYNLDTATNELKITGYVRGIAPFDVNSLVHVPGLGAFKCQSLTKIPSPLQRQKTDAMEITHGGTIASKPELQEPLEMFANPDCLDGEQNLIGFDDHESLGEGESDTNGDFARPEGWTDYQSSWLDGVEKVDFESETDFGELADELNKKSSRSDMSVTSDVMDVEDSDLGFAEERRVLAEQRRKEQTNNQQFPDEVEVEENEKAQQRFARYRSLKNFRKSHWDPKENLPDSYASIYHFASFKATQRSVMNEMREVIQAAEAAKGKFFGHSISTVEDSDAEDFLDGCIPTGSYVQLTLAGVDPKLLSSISTTALLVAISLLPHENKASVLHIGLSQPTKHEQTEDEPIKSKDLLTFRCGWRTWQARPVFSQNNLNCDKHKYERFLPQGGAFFAASIFGPVTYTPCPVLVFRETTKAGSRQLVATGSIIGADADRIVVKRIILTGYPVRVHKRHATVKYMFGNPEDVKWFKPAGLYTKHGLQGNIVESVGEHGTMKCLFNAPVKQHDTICLPLYKRIYPKFAQAIGDRKKDGMTYRETYTLTIR